jgi:NAD-dependent dihydropyrimidine dehydrogenase PreA subunit
VTKLHAIDRCKYFEGLFVAGKETDMYQVFKSRICLNTTAIPHNVTLCICCLSCWFKCPDWEPIKFEYYQPEVSPKWSVFLSTDRLTPNVCLNECFTNLFFLLMILCLPPSLVLAVLGSVLRKFLLVRKSYVIFILLTCILE